MAATFPAVAHSRKPLRRSRYGCRNCKLRKLKCDESKPQCRRCLSFGVLCNFISHNIPDLQLASASTKALSLGQVSELCHVPQLLTNAIWTSDSSTSFLLNTKCQDFIMRYLGRSLITPADPATRRANRKLLELAFAYPFLMHASLAVAFTYDRHLNTSTGCHRTLEECYHWSQSTLLMNKRLSEPINLQDKDPIWGTATALAILAISSADADTPEQAWPLKSSPSDLSWPRMVNGKMLLWHTANPMRPDSLFHVFAATYAQMNSPLPESGTEGVPYELATLCGINGSFTAETSPYFHAAHAVTQVLNLRDTEVTTGYTQLFLSGINGPFEMLLRDKDPVALLLLYLWYRKTSLSIWWIELRARVECPSILLYLNNYHAGNPVQEFLPGGRLANLWVT